MAKQIFGYLDHIKGTRKYRCYVPQTDSYGWSLWRSDAVVACPEDDPEGHYDHVNACHKIVLERCPVDGAALIEPYRPELYVDDHVGSNNK